MQYVRKPESSDKSFIISFLAYEGPVEMEGLIDETEWMYKSDRKSIENDIKSLESSGYIADINEYDESKLVTSNKEWRDKERSTRYLNVENRKIKNVEWIRYALTESGRDLLAKMISEGNRNAYFKNVRYEILGALDYCPLGFKSLSEYHLPDFDKDVLMYHLDDLKSGGYISTTVEHGIPDYDQRW